MTEVTMLWRRSVLVRARSAARLVEFCAGLVAELNQPRCGAREFGRVLRRARRARPLHDGLTQADVLEGLAERVVALDAEVLAPPLERRLQPMVVAGAERLPWAA